MATQKQILFSLLTFQLVLLPLLSSAITIQGVRNPISDLSSNFGAYQGVGEGSGTACAPGDVTCQNIAHQRQQVQSCGVAGLIGGVVGLAGFALGPVGFATTAGGAVLGCYIGATFFPQQGSNAFVAASNSIPGIGDILKALVTALSYVGQFIAFAADATNFYGALLVAAPEIGIIVDSMGALTIIWLFIEIASFVRGLGLGI